MVYNDNNPGNFLPPLQGLFFFTAIMTRLLVAIGQTQNGVRWSLTWPLDQWAKLDPAEQAAVIERQSALSGPVIWSRLEDKCETDRC